MDIQTMKAIAEFNRIVKNYLKILRLEKLHGQ